MTKFLHHLIGILATIYEQKTQNKYMKTHSMKVFIRHSVLEVIREFNNFPTIKCIQYIPIEYFDIIITMLRI